MSEDLEREIRSACNAGEWETAATIAIRGYGPELLGYLNALLRNPVEADDLFASVCENVWRALPKFAWQSSFRTWAYTITRNAFVSYQRGSRTRGAQIHGSSVVAAIAAEVRTSTASFMASEKKDKLSEIRDELDPDDRTLLILRIDRQLAWRDIAMVFEEPGASPAAIDKRAATLRKRLERLKAELRERLGR